MSERDPQLPAVAGDVLPCSLREFERRCLVWLMREQEKIAPDNSLVALICDAVRLGREHATAMRSGVNESLLNACKAALQSSYESEGGGWSHINRQLEEALEHTQGAPHVAK